MSKYIPVDPEKWGEMVKAQSDLVRYKEICDELDAECTRLKAEVERLTAVFVPENLILRAEVERLTAFTTRTIIPNEELQAQVERVGAENAHLHKGIYSLSLNVAQLKDEVERLKAEVERLTAVFVPENLILRAEVERLTKAGDAMASSIQFNEEMAQDYNGPTIVHQSVQRWNAAKEGKQP